MQRHLLLLLFIAFLAACKPTKIDTPIGGTDPQKPATATIVIIGSSTAAGWGASDYKYSWAGRLTQQLANSRVVNLAKGGYTSYQLLPTNATHPANRPEPDTLRNLNAALKEKPTTLILSISSNDLIIGCSVEEIIANFNTIRSKALAAGVAHVIITTPLPRNYSAEVTANLLLQRDQVMKTYGSSAVNIFDPLANTQHLTKPELLSEDGIHPNDTGHEVIFKIISGFLL
ncbi:SGNH/GDSL hydrolase family protein [Spirosoma sp.]|uniref:SGNH/GDSL hydrolase family protein n=1 Tax=Spirosoma sp. TaxID=1899569 RepID=UPI0026057840|nr:SGNH/GDSL hydrolase family protein [Spirosoma sp.]MCX6216340.1 SGNH/GDSL hydrolase family protein [Spirosoma sp.]